MKNTLHIVFVALSAMALSATAFAGGPLRVPGDTFMKHWVRETAESTRFSEDLVRESAVEALRESARFSREELERIGRGQGIFFAREIEMRIFLSGTGMPIFFKHLNALAAVRNETIAREAGEEFEEMREPEREPTVFPKSSPLRQEVEKIDLAWGESNIMNDNGVLLRAMRVEGAKELDSDAFEEIASGQLRAAYYERYEAGFPEVQISTHAVRFSARSAGAALRVVGIEGFDYNPRNIKKLLDGRLDEEDPDSSMRRAFFGLMNRLGMSSANGLIVSARAEVPEDGETRSHTLYLLLNRETGELLRVYVRSAHTR
jgi:hypothetical protein